MFRRTAISGAAVVSALVLLVGCGAVDDQSAEPPRASDPASSSEQEVHWSYSGESGPDRWGDLSSQFGACATGDEQSPIDLSGARPDDLANVEFLYQPTTFDVVNTGHTIQANATDAGGMEVDGERYELVQFHAHAPSEHTLQGEPADLELHLVHRSSDGHLAVIGVLMDEGGANAALERAWADMPEPGKSVAVTSFDPTALLPSDRLTYRYDGSLTTPPCTEGVRWLVLQQPGSLAAATVDAFSRLFGPNARPVQPREERPLLLDASVDR